MTRRLSIVDVQKMKAAGEKIVMLTAYDAMSAKAAESAGVPLLLVGDTLGMVIQGHDSTIPVTLDHMIYHSEIVVRVTQRPLIVGDLPFLTYNINPEQALENAGRLFQESGVGCVKLEGGEKLAPTIARIVEAGIPVMGHIGLRPQSVAQVGGFRVQGRDYDAALQLVRDVHAIQDAGAFAIVFELIPAPLAAFITQRLRIPTIGIGAGPGCDGQVQVFHDILGLFDAFVPRHTHQYGNLLGAVGNAISAYVANVHDGTFPTQENSFEMDADVITQLMATLAQEQ